LKIRRFKPLEQARDRYPAVIVVHAIAGYRDANEGYVAAESRKAGFATLTYDSFAARGTTGTALQGSPGYLPPGVADAYAALRFLSGENRIDAEHVAIIGFSYGAEVAHLAALKTLRSALNPGPSRFAAHVAFYPGGTFGAAAEPGAYTGAPVLMLLGDKDENLPVTKIESYLAYARAAGTPAPIETVIYPGAYHAWTFPISHRALLPGFRQHEKMSAHPAPAEAASPPHQWRGPSTRPPLVSASPQRPAIQWDLTRRFAHDRSLIRFLSFNETCVRRVGGLASLPYAQPGAPPCPLQVKNSCLPQRNSCDFWVFLTTPNLKSAAWRPRYHYRSPVPSSDEHAAPLRHRHKAFFDQLSTQDDSGVRQGGRAVASGPHYSDSRCRSLRGAAIVLRRTSKMTAVDQPNNSTPFIAVIGPSKCQRSNGVTSPYPSVV
jgi:dienelactone hydrolase